MPAVRCLSFHAAYRCRRTGRCCTSDWPIPVEADRLARLRAALATGVLRPADPGVPADAVLLAAPGLPADTPAILANRNRRCVFLHVAADPASGFGPGTSSTGGTATSCAIHDALGHDALPLACRQFPRVSVLDPRGVSVTLSHYCPTAAALLEQAGAVEIVTTPASFPADGEYDGLDARLSLPPLLRPDLLMDWASWWDWESRSVNLLANDRRPVADRLRRLSGIVAHVRQWTPASGPLAPAIARAFDASSDADALAAPVDIEARHREVIAAIPETLRGGIPASGTGAAPPDDTLGRLLAAHAFGNWTAHLGRGLRTWLRSIEAAYALARAGRTVGDADLLLRHLADPNHLARVWSDAERP
jgi:hypothetical protein